MGNDEKLSDLIMKTKAWNDQRGISNEDEALVFDIYLDRDCFDLHMELDKKFDKISPITQDGSIRFLTI